MQIDHILIGEGIQV